MRHADPVVKIRQPCEQADLAALVDACGLGFKSLCSNDSRPAGGKLPGS